MNAVWTIRSFLNTDTPYLAKLWHHHHTAFNSKSACPISVWDQCILSKPFFKCDGLMLVTNQVSVPVGFIHFGFASNADGSDASDSVAIVHKICVAPSEDEDAIAKVLIDYALIQLRKQNAKTCSALGTTALNAFYLGVGEGDNLNRSLSLDASEIFGLFQLKARHGKGTRNIGPKPPL